MRLASVTIIQYPLDIKKATTLLLPNPRTEDSPSTMRFYLLWAYAHAASLHLLSSTPCFGVGLRNVI